MEVYGRYGVPFGKIINVDIWQCEESEEVQCKTEEEIKKWLSGKYIILLYNQIVFDQENYFSDARKKEARIEYIPISSQVR